MPFVRKSRKYTLSAAIIQLQNIPEKEESKMHVCNVCGWVYDESKGLPGYGIEPGTKWEDLPEDFRCPLCTAEKDVFMSV